MQDRDIPTVLGRLRIQVGGGGPAMIFWPSLLMDGSMWSAQAAHFESDHQVVVVDPPGHGPTTRRTRPEVMSFIEQSIRDASVRSCSWAVTTVVPRRPDQHALFAKIQAPVLVIAGAQDATFPVPETRRMADAIPGSRFVVLDNAAHLAALEVPDQVNELIDGFLQ
jgi:pimeloyl-ACP methyl ester carboxylesterase